jgi:uncharacterized repeat protein (TIGR01451 family)
VQIEIGNNDLNPWLPGNGSFGLYNWRQNAVQGNPLPWTAPFTNGAKIGHCVELEQGSGTVNGTLRSGADLSLNNPTNTITPGNTDARVAQIQWLLQSSYRAAAVNGPNFQNGVEPGAHQSAIWKITNPNDAANDIGTGTATRAAADALADQLLAAAQANYGALDQSTWSLSIQGGNGPSCTGTTRTVLVKGSPNTVAHLTITAGTAHFPNGTQQTDVVLGADGTGSVNLVDDGTTADTVSISASLPSWILAQADNGSNQDFAYLENGGNVTKEVSVSFQPCNELQPLAISKTADPLFTRNYTWTIKKDVDRTTVTTTDSTAAFTYTLVATRNNGTDADYGLRGTIRIENPNATAIAATIADSLAPCDIDASMAGVQNSLAVNVPPAANGTNGVIAVNYTCDLGDTAPAGPVTNNVTVTTQQFGAQQASSNAAAFTTPTTVTGETANTFDVLDGGQPVQVNGAACGTAGNPPPCTYTYTKTFPVPTTATCVEHPNSAYTKDSSGNQSPPDSETVKVCGEGQVGPSGKPERTKITVTKASNKEMVRAGKNVIFTIRFKVTGKAAAVDVKVCDKLPSAMVFVSSPGAVYQKGQACWLRKSVKPGTTLVFRVTAKVDSNAGVGTACNNVVATASNATAARDKVCVAIRPRAGRVGGGTVGVTG